MFERQTYYDLLGVDYDASREEIRQAYKRMLDVYKDDQKKLKEVKNAWAVLSWQQEREAYDKRNKIDELRRMRQRMNRIPITLVGDDLGHVPGTIVVDNDRDATGLPGTIVVDGPQAKDIPESIKIGDTPAPAPQPAAEPSQPPLAVTLEVRPLTGKPWSRKLAAGEFTVGRLTGSKADHCDIGLPDPDRFISRRHAVFVVRPDGFFLRDERSGNGAYVNGHRIPMGQTAKLEDNDHITIEGHVLTVHLESEPGNSV